MADRASGSFLSAGKIPAGTAEVGSPSDRLCNEVVDAADIDGEHVYSMPASLRMIECQTIRIVGIDSQWEMQVHKHVPLIGMLSIVIVGMGEWRRRNTGQKANRRTYRNQFTSHPESQDPPDWLG